MKAIVFVLALVGLGCSQRPLTLDPQEIQSQTYWLPARTIIIAPPGEPVLVNDGVETHKVGRLDLDVGMFGFTIRATTQKE